jgi:DNA-directed RNA polymerase subunit RPC12/RpoP
MTEFDTDYTDEVVCPYCGYEHSDSYELAEYGKMDCHHCDEEFTIEADISITYSTSKIKKTGAQ